MIVSGQADGEEAGFLRLLRQCQLFFQEADDVFDRVQVFRNQLFVFDFDLKVLSMKATSSRTPVESMILFQHGLVVHEVSGFSSMKFSRMKFRI